MAKDVQAALESGKTTESAKTIDGDDGVADRSQAPGFKMTFTPDEQSEISLKRREMRQRLFADD